MAGRLTAKQQRFIEEYLIDLNGTQAAIRAGYSPKTASSIAYELLRKPQVRARLDEAIAERSRRTGVNQDRVIRELARLGFVNAADVINFDDATLRPGASADDTAAIASVRVKRVQTADGEVVEREIRLADKTRALELLGKHLGMFKDGAVNVNVGVQIIDDIGAETDDGDDRTDQG